TGAVRHGTARGGRLVDIGGDDAATRPGAADKRKIDAALAGQPPRQRGGVGTARRLGRAVIALGRAYFAERVHVRIGQRRSFGPLVPAQAGIQFFPSLYRGALDPRFRRGERRLRRVRWSGGLWPHRLSRRRDHRHHGAYFGGLTDLEANIGERPGGGGRHFHRCLVGLDLKQVVARLDDVAGRLEPFHDLALGDGLAELRHQDVHANSSFVVITGPARSAVTR